MKLPTDFAKQGFGTMMQMAKDAMAQAVEMEKQMQSEQTKLQVKKSFSASAERVFDAWIDPSRAKKFLFATPTGEITRCEIDARPGGKFTITRRDEQGDTEHVGEYEVVDRPRKLVFTFGVPRYDAAMTRVTIDITPTASGCDLTLTHEEVSAEWKDQTVQGWTMILGNLAKILD